MRADLYMNCHSNLVRKPRLEKKYWEVDEEAVDF